jgi:hypothetical protein
MRRKDALWSLLLAHCEIIGLKLLGGGARSVIVRVDGDLNGHVAPGDSRFTLLSLRARARARSQNECDSGNHPCHAMN